MSWLFSQALVEAFSAENCSVGKQHALLKSMPIAQIYCCNDKTMESSNHSQFGMTCEHLTVGLGEELLTWYLAAFHAKTSASAAKVKDFTVKEVPFGEKWPASLAKYDRNTHSWKIHQLSLAEDLAKSWENWPRWGIMHDGEFFPLAPLVHHIHARGCSFWPTLTASDGVKRFKAQLKQTTQQENGRWIITRKSGVYGAKLTDALGGKPSQAFAEWMMGFPIGWTQFARLEMPKFQQWQLLHGAIF